MGNPLKYSTPAERLRGLSFSEIGGTFSGSNNIIYTLEGNEFDSSKIAIQCNFTPAFNWDEDITRTIYDSTAPDRYAIVKRNAASSYFLSVTLGNVIVANIANSAYSPYWIQGQENILIINGESSNSSFFLNNNAIGTSASAWLSKQALNFFLGSSFVGSAYYLGDISKIKVFRNTLTLQEITDIQNNSTYNYINNPLIHYPMTAATQSGSQTLDISGNELHGTLIGSPTKLSGKGYSFNGSTQYITFPEQTFTGEFSIAMFNKPNDTTLDGLVGHVSDSNKILLNSGNIFVRVVTNSDTTILAPGTVVNFTGLTRDADNKVDLYVNGKKYRLFNDVAQSGSSLWDFIGRTESGTQNLDGNIYDVFIDNKCLTPTQMHDMYVRGINVR